MVSHVPGKGSVRVYCRFDSVNADFSYCCSIAIGEALYGFDVCLALRSRCPAFWAAAPVSALREALILLRLGVLGGAERVISSLALVWVASCGRPQKAWDRGRAGAIAMFVED